MQGVGQSFLNLNKFPDAVPALGQGEPAQVGISSSGGRGLSAKEPLWGGFPCNFPFSKFIIVMGMVLGICVVLLFALGLDMGLAIMHTLYLLVGISFLLFSLVFVPLLTNGLMLGWAGLD